MPGARFPGFSWDSHPQHGGHAPTGTITPLPSDDPKQRRPDITLARTRLGWEPQITLSEGLDRTIAYFAQLLDSPQDRLPNPMPQLVRLAA